MSTTEKKSKLNEGVVILWDVENVIPSSDSFFVDGLIEYSSRFGRVVMSKAYADWTSRLFSKLIPQLSDNHFELIHVYNPNKLKNSSDILMITHGMEIAMQYPTVSHFILVTGDSDFRPLVTSLRRNGKLVHIICDNKRVTDSLLALADDFIDYREIIPGGNEPDDTEPEIYVEQVKHRGSQGTSTSIKNKKSKDSKQDLQMKNFALLGETVRLMEDKKIDTNLSAVKVRLKLLNPSFNEQNLGFSQWSKFVERAVDLGHIKLEGIIGTQAKLSSDVKPTGESILDKEANSMVETLKNLDKNGKPKFHLFSQVAAKMKEDGIDYMLFGYKRFKGYVASLETRNLVMTKVNGLKHSIKRIN